ncbi:MAG TPA: ATP-binding protein [Gemmatimonadaceae bacterium]|nr:ATP-binding protein [Gemmatimonadaceae bacterium]
MRPSYFVLYSAVVTQAATALLLSCALYVLGRYYPRYFLRLWAGAWLAESLHAATGILAVMLRTPGGAPDGIVPTLATWVSQSAGYSHCVLLVLGAWALYREHTRPTRTGAYVVAACIVLAMLPTFAVPHDASAAAIEMRLVMRVGLMSALASAAAIAAAMLIRRTTIKGPALGIRWMGVILLFFGLHRIVVMLVLTSQVFSGDTVMELLQALPLVDILLTAALGIGTAIAMVEDEQREVRAVAERQVDAERRARAQGASLVSALAAVPDLVSVIDTQARLVAWNPAFATFVTSHGSTAPAVGMGVLDAMPKSAVADWTPRIAALLEGTDQLFEATIERPDVAPDYFDVSARPMRDAAELVGGVIVARDVTERRKLEQQLQQAQRLDTVGRLAGGIAHDFNNLLTAILSSASVARECLPPDHEVQADLADVQLAGERATQLTKQLLAFARRQPVSQQPIELNDRVATMERMLSRLVGPDVVLRVTLGDGLWLVRADGPQLEQVLVNVAVNARDAMPDGGRLTIRTANRVLTDGTVVLPRPMPAGDYVEIVVSDTGAGMDEETLAHVFEPFYTTKPVGQGTGLGLAMCYGIIRQHHGVIWIESSPGRGSTVNILLPRYEGPLPAARIGRLPSETPSLVTTGTETILLVEDEPQVRAVAARALRAAGYRVLEATNGRDGVQVARRERDVIDMIVSDVVMPEMGGKEMVELARHFLPSVAVLFVSGYTAGNFPLPTDDPSANLFLQKPFTPQELLVMVRQVLDRHAALREARATIATP